MTAPDDAARAVQRALQDSGDLPDRTSYVLEEADPDGTHSNVSLPLVEMQIGTVEILDDSNTNYVGNVTDDDGNSIGRIYDSHYEMDLEINVWTVDGSDYNVDGLGATVRHALRRYTANGPDQNFTDEDGEPIDDIWKFELISGDRQDDLTQTPSVRRWQQLATVWSYERLKTTEPYIADVNQNVQ